MRCKTLLALTMFIAYITIVHVPCYADTMGSAKNIAEKVTKPNWLSQEALKISFVGTYCASQALSGMVEGYHFRNGGDTFYINGSNYHAFETARDIMWIGTGWTGYANVRNPYQSKWGKARRLLGTALLGRDIKEWAYKTARYNNPFDYTSAHNEHAVVYFGIRKGEVVDLYFGTGPVSGPIVDIACATAGVLLLTWK